MNQIVLDVIWYMAMWHALAKLRLHTDSTLQVLELVTVLMGRSVRLFSRESAKLDVRDLSGEEAARGRRSAASRAKTTEKGKQSAKPGTSKPSAGDSNTRQDKRRILNLKMFKFHNTGHLVSAIRRFGTSDNYTTQIVRNSAPYNTEFN